MSEWIEEYLAPSDYLISNWNASIELRFGEPRMMFLFGPNGSTRSQSKSGGLIYNLATSSGESLLYAHTWSTRSFREEQMRFLAALDFRMNVSLQRRAMLDSILNPSRVLYGEFSGDFSQGDPHLGVSIIPSVRLIDQVQKSVELEFSKLDGALPTDPIGIEFAS